MRSFLSLIAVLAFVVTSDAFAPAALAPRMALRSSSTRAGARVGSLSMTQDQQDTGDNKRRRSGASIDADGKSNVWALEPKIVVVDPSNKADEGANPIIVSPLSHPNHAPPSSPPAACAAAAPSSPSERPSSLDKHHNVLIGAVSVQAPAALVAGLGAIAAILAFLPVNNVEQ